MTTVGKQVPIEADFVDKNKHPEVPAQLLEHQMQKVQRLLLDKLEHVKKCAMCPVTDHNDFHGGSLTTAECLGAKTSHNAGK